MMKNSGAQAEYTTDLLSRNILLLIDLVVVCRI